MGESDNIFTGLSISYHGYVVCDVKALAIVGIAEWSDPYITHEERTACEGEREREREWENNFTLCK